MWKDKLLALKGAVTVGWPWLVEPNGFTNLSLRDWSVCMHIGYNMEVVWMEIHVFILNKHLLQLVYPVELMALSSANKACCCCWIVNVDSWWSANRWRQMYGKGQSKPGYSWRSVESSNDSFLITKITCCLLCQPVSNWETPVATKIQKIRIYFYIFTFF